MVVDADDVAGDRILARDTLVGHERQRMRDLHLAVGTQVAYFHSRHEASRAHAEECDAVAMLRVHVRLDLENEAREGRLGRLHDAHAAVARLRRRCPFDQRLQDLLHAEVVDPGTEEHRRLRSAQERELERVARAADQVHVMAKRVDLAREQAREPRVVESADHFGVVGDALAARCEPQQAIVAEVVDAAEALAHADRPGDRRTIDRQNGFDFLEERKRLAHFAVHLVDERDDRRVAQTATSSSLIVCASTPFAASITITAASTAVSTR